MEETSQDTNTVLNETETPQDTNIVLNETETSQDTNIVLNETETQSIIDKLQDHIYEYSNETQQLFKVVVHQTFPGKVKIETIIIEPNKIQKTMETVVNTFASRNWKISSGTNGHTTYQKNGKYLQNGDPIIQYTFNDSHWFISVPNNKIDLLMFRNLMINAYPNLSFTQYDKACFK